ncbi:MAG: hypothetical protein JXQ75_21395 [Phycisphaerae bacterium]|nr:hypothetical protein [Phycisphaerae bacterium]
MSRRAAASVLAFGVVSLRASKLDGEDVFLVGDVQLLQFAVGMGKPAKQVWLQVGVPAVLGQACDDFALQAREEPAALLVAFDVLWTRLRHEMSPSARMGQWIAGTTFLSASVASTGLVCLPRCHRSVPSLKTRTWGGAGQIGNRGNSPSVAVVLDGSGFTLGNIFAPPNG